jgi:hypothetical protein
MANKFQIKRTSVTGRTPNTTNVANTAYLDAGELAVNLTDGKLFSSNGTLPFEVGANLVNLSVTGNASMNGVTTVSTIKFSDNTTLTTAPSGDSLAVVYAIALG